MDFNTEPAKRLNESCDVLLDLINDSLRNRAYCHGAHGRILGRLEEVFETDVDF